MDEDALTVLAGRTYSATELTDACEITQDQLTNYTSKSKFILSSEATVRGRSRKYCLIDVYALGLLARLTELTRKQDWSARSIEYLLYIGPEEINKTYPLREMVAFPASKLDEARCRLRYNPRSAHPVFTHRDLKKSAWVLFAETYEIEIPLYGLRAVDSSGSANNIKTIEAGYAINATWLLWRIDQALIRNHSGSPCS